MPASSQSLRHTPWHRTTPKGYVLKKYPKAWAFHDGDNELWEIQATENGPAISRVFTTPQDAWRDAAQEIANVR